MPSKQDLLRMQLANNLRANKEPFIKKYQQNINNPYKYDDPLYIKDLTNALSAAKQREIQNKRYLKPETRAYLNSYDPDVVNILGQAYKTMHPRNRENVMKLGQKILNNPGSYNEVYQAVLNNAYSPLSLVQKSNIEASLVSKLGYGYIQKATAKDKAIVEPIQEKIRDKRIGKRQPKIQTTEIQKQELKKPIKKEDKTQPQQIQKADKFADVKIVNSPAVEAPKIDKKYKRSMQSALKKVTDNKRLEKKAPDIDKLYKIVEVEGSPITKEKYWKTSKTGLTPDQKKRGLTHEDLFYQAATDEKLIRDVEKGLYKGVKYSKNNFYAENRASLEKLGSTNVIMSGKDIIRFTDFNKYTRKTDLPWHPAYMRGAKKQFELRNPETGEIIKSITRKNTKAILLDRDIKTAKDTYQLIYEKREIKANQYDPNRIEGYGPWETYGVTRQYKNRLVERIKKMFDVVDEPTEEPTITPPQVEEPKLKDYTKEFEDSTPDTDLNPEEPEDKTKIDLEELIQTYDEIKNPKYGVIPIPDFPHEETDDFDPELAARKAIGKRANKAKIGLENWFRCARIEFGRNIARLPVLLDLATRVANIDPSLLFKDRTTIDYWYRTFGPMRADELITNLENVSGLKADDTIKGYENTEERNQKIRRWYANRLEHQLREDLLQQGYTTGPELEKMLRKMMKEYGY